MSTGRIYIAEPWASLVLSGQKVIETAHIRLPAQFIGRWLDVQAAGGLRLGRVKFSGWRRYDSTEDFESEYLLHHVPKGSRFHFEARRQTFGWKVAGAEAYEPVKGPAMRSQYRLELYK